MTRSTPRGAVCARPGDPDVHHDGDTLDRAGYQVEAAIAALHDDAASAAETAVRGHLHELDGDLPAAAVAYAEAARRATDVTERDHLIRQAARARAAP